VASASRQRASTCATSSDLAGRMRAASGIA
jgi:hypothetical protein